MHCWENARHFEIMLVNIQAGFETSLGDVLAISSNESNVFVCEPKYIYRFDYVLRTVVPFPK